MNFHLVRINFQGKVAVANLVAFGLFSLIWSAGISGLYHVPRTALLVVTELLLPIVTFPVGWLTILGTMGSNELRVGMACILIPLNAYLWGYVAARLRQGIVGD